MELTASNRSSGGPVWVPPIGRHAGVERASADAVRGRNINSQPMTQRDTGLKASPGTYGAALYLPGMNAGVSRAKR